MTRLLYVHNIAMPGPEANTVNVAKMCAAFAAQGCEVRLAALPGAPRGDLKSDISRHYGLSDEFEVMALSPLCRRPSFAALAGAWLSTSQPTDLVYTRAPHVAWLACKQGIDTVLEVHADIHAFSPLGAKLLKATIASRRLRGLVVISQALAARLNQSLSAPIKMIVAHGGADCTNQKPMPADNARFAAGFVGRFYRGRGLELIAALARACPWADFHLAGGEAHELGAFIGSAPSNMIVHGSLPHAEVGRLMQRCNVLLAPYQRAVFVADGRTDTASWMSPLKVFEYMAAARPIIASDLPALREVLRPNQTAILCGPDNAGAWIEALEHLAARPELCCALAAHAFKDLHAHYTWRARARHILDECGIGACNQETVRARLHTEC